MKHDRQQVGLCLYCRWWCPRCNDCGCPGNGWTRYRATACPGHDTRAGAQRPVRAGG